MQKWIEKLKKRETPNKKVKERDKIKVNKIIISLKNEQYGK